MQTLFYKEEHDQVVNGGITHLVLLRDAVILAPLLSTQSRGANTGVWRLLNLKLP